MLPESNMQIISMGMSYGKSLNCPDAYNDMTSLAFVWSALVKALRIGNADVCGPGPSCGQVTAELESVLTSSASSRKAISTNATDTKAVAKAPFQRRTRRHRLLETSTSIPHADWNDGGFVDWAKRRLAGMRAMLPASTNFLASLLPTRTPSPPHPVLIPKPDESPVVGSCYCGCPPDLLVGTCFNVKKDKAPADKRCSSIQVPKVITLESVCPSVGLVLQCDPAVYKPEAMCTNETLQGGGMKCHSATTCQAVPGLPGTHQATCQCLPTEWVDDDGDPTCTWSDDPCIFSAYVTP